MFASALGGNKRAELIGERTLGRAARQQLVKLPDGSGLLLSSVRYLTPASAGIHERGLAPDVEVEQPDVEFGAATANERRHARQSDPAIHRAEESRVVPTSAASPERGLDFARAESKDPARRPEKSRFLVDTSFVVAYNRVQQPRSTRRSRRTIRVRRVCCASE
jgi:C-terminal processing protease CtpA/Prc